MNEKSKGIHNITCTIPKNLLNTGVHYVTLGCSSWEPFNQFHFIKEEILGFDIYPICPGLILFFVLFNSEKFSLFLITAPSLIFTLFSELELFDLLDIAFDFKCISCNIY